MPVQTPLDTLNRVRADYFEPYAAGEDAPGSTPSRVALFAHELVKSLGVRYERGREGEWEWTANLGNIAESMREDPFWTTLDWAIIGFGPAKLSVAAARVARGGGVAGAAYQAGRFAGKAPRTLTGKAVGIVTGKELAKAAEVSMRAPRRGLMGAVTSPAGRVDPEYRALAEEFLGVDPAEIRGLSEAASRELLAGQTYYKRMGEELARQVERAGLTRPQHEQWVRFMETGVEPVDPSVLRALGPKGRNLYDRQWHFRNEIHEMSFRLKLISEKTYTKNLKKYSPRLYEEFMNARRTMGGRHAGQVGYDRYLARTHFEAPEELHRIFDARLEATELARAGQAIAKHSWAQGLARSSVAKTAKELGEHFHKIATSGNTRLQRLHKMSPELVEDLKLFGVPQTNALAADIAESLGWRRLQDLPGMDKVPGYIADLPKELKDKWIDPIALNDVYGAARVAKSPLSSPAYWYERLSSDISKFYVGTIMTFQIAKTAYNPATQVRNLFGALMFHHLAVGGSGAFNTKHLKAGWKAWSKGPLSQDWVDAARAGVVNDVWDRELQEIFTDLYGRTRGRATGLDWLGDGKIRGWLQAGAGKAERLYRATDEIVKLDAFIRLKNKYVKGGLAKEDAIAEAMIQVSKYFPVYAQQSPLTRLLRGKVPFASFTTEAARIWRNALIEKPHLVYFWANSIDLASQASAAINGFSPEEVEAAREGLPPFLKNKKTFLFPLRVDGKPVFQDWSYIIPLAQISESLNAESSLMQTAGLNITSNPFLNLAIAGATGYDPFSRREIAPRQTESYIGRVPGGERARFTVGLAEHAAAMMLPPLVPPGYAGMNFIEMATGRRHPFTGEEMEQGVWRTIASNVFAARLYEADVAAQVSTVRQKNRLIDKRISQAWDRWERAHANAWVDDLESERAEILELYQQRGASKAEAEKKFETNAKRHEPAAYRSMPSKQIQEVLERARLYGLSSERDRRAMSVLARRLHERRQRGGGRRRRRP